MQLLGDFCEVVLTVIGVVVMQPDAVVPQYSGMQDTDYFSPRVIIRMTLTLLPHIIVAFFCLYLGCQFPISQLHFGQSVHASIAIFVEQSSGHSPDWWMGVPAFVYHYE